MKDNLEKLLNAGYAVTTCKNFKGKHKYTILISDGFDYEIHLKTNDIDATLLDAINRLKLEPKSILKISK